MSTCCATSVGGLGAHLLLFGLLDGVGEVGQSIAHLSSSDVGGGVLESLGMVVSWVRLRRGVWHRVRHVGGGQRATMKGNERTRLSCCENGEMLQGGRVLGRGGFGG